MPCSSSDRFATEPRSRAERDARDRHLAACDACRARSEELRRVEALLETPRVAGLPPNFTFRVMADVRALAPPRVARTPLRRVLAAYLVFAWVAIALFFGAGFATAATSLDAARASLDTAARVFGGVAAALISLCQNDLFGVGLSMAAVLVVDVLAIIAALATSRAVRARLAPVAAARFDPYEW